MLVFYELESEQTSERGRDNRYARAKRGLWVTSTVTGYKKDPEKPGQLIPIYYEKGHPLDVSWKREGRLKKWNAFI